VTAPTTTDHGLVNFKPHDLTAAALPDGRAARRERGGDRQKGSTMSRSSQDFAKNRALLPNSLLVGFELPARQLITPAAMLAGCRGTADRLSAGFHRWRFRRAFEQPLALRRLIGSQIGVAGFVAYRDNHAGAARSLGCGLVPAAFETALEAEPCPRFGELVAATAMGHSATRDPASIQDA